MLVLTFYGKNKIGSENIKGFSLCAVSKPVLFVCAFLGCVSLSSAYHSMLYGYTMANWAIPFVIGSIIPFGLRFRVGLNSDKTVLYRQQLLFGVLIREESFAGEYKGFSLIDTEATPGQYYMVVNGLNVGESVHYCKVQSKAVAPLERKLSFMLGFEQ